MKRLIGIIILLFIMVSVLRCCIKADIPEEKSIKKVSEDISDIVYPEDNKNITLNGADYIQSQAPVGKYGGEIVLSVIGEGPKTFNPCNTKDAVSSAMTSILYEGLFTTDAKNGNVIPQLAKSYYIDGNDYIINLRKGIKWSDGTPITIDDVVYTYEEIVFKGLGNPSTMDAMKIDGELPKLTKIDDNTVKFTTSKPFAPFLRQLSYPIVPKHYFKPYSDKGASEFNAFLNTNTKPENIVSNGPFKLREYVAAQRVVFVRNPYYYKVNKNNQPLPYLDKIVYLIVGDTNNVILKFEAKELDVIALNGSNAARYKELEPKSDYIIYNLGASTGTLFTVVNLNNRKNNEGVCYVNPVKQKWLRDKNFRKAIDYAIDRKNMINNIAYGVAAPLHTPESPNSIYLNKNIKGHPVNKEKSLQLLTDSGFIIKNNRLYDKQGNFVELDLYTNAGNLEREALGVVIKQDLEELGMKINFKPIEFNSLVNKLTNTHDWDLVIMGLTGSPIEPHDGKNVWTSGGTLHMFNMGVPKDERFDWEKELDNLFEEGALKIKYEDRKPIYDRYQEIIYEENPIIYLYSPMQLYAIRKKIKNVFPSALNGLLYNLDEVYIDN